MALKVAERSAQTAANALLAVAILLSLGSVMLFVQGAPDGAGSLFETLRLVQVGLALVFWVFYSAAKKAPERAYMPAIVGAALYTPLVLVQYVGNPAMILAPGTIFVVLVVGGLVTGIRASLRYRDYLRKQEEREQEE